MKRLIAATLAAAFVTAGAVAAQAQGTSGNSPGHQMQLNGSVQGSPGASGYAPGHQMQEKGSVSGTTGASGYAPGHATTGAAVNADVGVKAGKTHVNGKAGAKMK